MSKPVEDTIEILKKTPELAEDLIRSYFDENRDLFNEEKCLYNARALFYGSLSFEAEKEKIKKMDIESPICGAKIQGIIWMCKDCGIDPSSCYCNDCFEKEFHKNHHIKFYNGENAQGICDCGDQNAIKKESFCKKHKAYDPSKSSIQIIDKYRQLIAPIILAKLGHRIHTLLIPENSEKKEEVIIKVKLYLELIFELANLNYIFHGMVCEMLVNIDTEIQTTHKCKQKYFFDATEESIFNSILELHPEIKKEYSEKELHICSCTLICKLIKIIFLNIDEEKICNFFASSIKLFYKFLFHFYVAFAQHFSWIIYNLPEKAESYSAYAQLLAQVNDPSLAEFMKKSGKNEFFYMIIENFIQIYSELSNHDAKYRAKYLFDIVAETSLRGFTIKYLVTQDFLEKFFNIITPYQYSNSLYNLSPPQLIDNQAINFNITILGIFANVINNIPKDYLPVWMLTTFDMLANFSSSSRLNMENYSHISIIYERILTFVVLQLLLLNYLTQDNGVMPINLNLIKESVSQISSFITKFKDIHTFVSGIEDITYSMSKGILYFMYHLLSKDVVKDTLSTLIKNDSGILLHSNLLGLQLTQLLSPKPFFVVESLTKLFGISWDGSNIQLMSKVDKELYFLKIEFLTFLICSLCSSDYSLILCASKYSPTLLGYQEEENIRNLRNIFLGSLCKRNILSTFLNQRKSIVQTKDIINELDHIFTDSKTNFYVPHFSELFSRLNEEKDYASFKLKPNSISFIDLFGDANISEFNLKEESMLKFFKENKIPYPKEVSSFANESTKQIVRYFNLSLRRSNLIQKLSRIINSINDISDGTILFSTVIISNILNACLNENSPYIKEELAYQFDNSNKLIERILSINAKHELFNELINDTVSKIAHICDADLPTINPLLTVSGIKFDKPSKGKGYQQKLLEEFKQKQSKFESSNKTGLNMILKESIQIGQRPCIICKTTIKVNETCGIIAFRFDADLENAIVSLAFNKYKTILNEVIPRPQNLTSMLNTCNHLIHEQCLKKYCDEKHPASLDIFNSVSNYRCFECPLCKNLSNSFFPLLQDSLIPNKDDLNNCCTYLKNLNIINEENQHNIDLIIKNTSTFLFYNTNFLEFKNVHKFISNKLPIFRAIISFLKHSLILLYKENNDLRNEIEKLFSEKLQNLINLIPQSFGINEFIYIILCNMLAKEFKVNIPLNIMTSNINDSIEKIIFTVLLKEFLLSSELNKGFTYFYEKDEKYLIESLLRSFLQLFYIYGSIIDPNLINEEMFQEKVQIIKWINNMGIKIEEDLSQYCQRIYQKYSMVWQAKFNIPSLIFGNKYNILSTLSSGSKYSDFYNLILSTKCKYCNEIPFYYCYFCTNLICSNKKDCFVKHNVLCKSLLGCYLFLSIKNSSTVIVYKNAKFSMKSPFQNELGESIDQISKTGISDSEVMKQFFLKKEVLVEFLDNILSGHIMEHIYKNLNSNS